MQLSYLLIAVGVILIIVFAVIGKKSQLIASAVFLMCIVGVSIGQYIKIHHPTHYKNQ